MPPLDSAEAAQPPTTVKNELFGNIDADLAGPDPVMDASTPAADDDGNLVLDNRVEGTEAAELSEAELDALSADDALLDEVIGEEPD